MTPTRLVTAALDGAHTLYEPADYREQHVNATSREQDPSHDWRLLPSARPGNSADED
jgi:hypothetical protein